MLAIMKKILLAISIILVSFSSYLLYGSFQQDRELSKVETFKKQIENHAKYLSERKNFFAEGEFTWNNEYDNLDEYKSKTVGRFNENELWSCGVPKEYYEIYFNKLDSNTSNQLVENCFEESVNPSHIKWYKVE